MQVNVIGKVIKKIIEEKEFDKKKKVSLVVQVLQIPDSDNQYAELLKLKSDDFNLHIHEGQDYSFSCNAFVWSMDKSKGLSLKIIDFEEVESSDFERVE